MGSRDHFTPNDEDPPIEYTVPVPPDGMRTALPAWAAYEDDADPPQRRSVDGVVEMMDRLQTQRERKHSTSKLSLLNSTDLLSMHFDDLRWVVPGLVPEGLTILAGRQKLGKTWLAIDWAIAKATGGFAMASISCTPGDVLYVDMENGPRRIKSRLETLVPDEDQRAPLSRLTWATEAPMLNAGLIGALESWRKSVPAPALVVIDVLQRVKPAGSNARNAYENDYSTFSGLQTWATENRIGVLGLHHTRKGGADDPLEALSGSNGLSACADTTLVLDRDQHGSTLYVRGRDVEERELALVFTGGLWGVLGEASTVRRSDERTVIVEALKEHGEPMSPSELASALGKHHNNVKQLLFQMAKAGQVHRVSRGRYWIEPLHPDNPDNPDNRHENEPEKIGESSVLKVIEDRSDQITSAPKATLKPVHDTVPAVLSAAGEQ